MLERSFFTQNVIIERLLLLTPHSRHNALIAQHTISKSRAARACSRANVSSRVEITFDSYKPEMGAHGKLNLQYPASHNDGKAKARGNGASIHRVVMHSRLEFERVQDLLAALEQPRLRKFNIAQVCALVRSDSGVAAMLLRCAAAVQPDVIFKWFRDELQKNTDQTKQLIEISKISHIHKDDKKSGQDRVAPCVPAVHERAESRRTKVLQC
jgi:hypothetical protein